MRTESLIRGPETPSAFHPLPAVIRVYDEAGDFIQTHEHKGKFIVGMQIRESNIQARAGAYREIGISTAEFHRGFSARMNRVATESEYAEAVKQWTLEDWETMERIETADLRMLEMIQLQVEQGLLPTDAVSRLGYNWGAIPFPFV